ncbi:sulfite exporter TauE/SafE family protein [Tateyamaria omphalii]|uniref:sulfite exporter TauE/SafE family protein n=1 Tax=Tateyamaria omphalii TaxID=299262 RepID=UPI001C9941C8|nr:sulfite exporter TauE/SafE family protein [Tateyamaria omphalii]MBY5934019.1 sulfite exporter TauE/SafE family protein [Tateyamaria omphalii]
MSGMIADTLALPGFGWVLVVTMVAGVVYGFAGFGAALVYMPVATAFVPVEMAIAAFGVTALASLVSVVPRAWSQADRPNVVLMIVVATLALPLGIAILRLNDVTTMRWAVLGVTTLTLVALVLGWRYRAAPTRAARVSVAAATGVVGGATGLVGPIMVLFQLSGQEGVARARANTLVFLTITGLLTVPLMAMQGLLTVEAVVLGLMLIVPYGVASRIGQALFDPAMQVLYRRVAYVIIAVAIVMGLPVFGE